MCLDCSKSILSVHIRSPLVLYLHILSYVHQGCPLRAIVASKFVTFFVDTMHVTFQLNEQEFQSYGNNQETMTQFVGRNCNDPRVGYNNVGESGLAWALSSF